MHKNQLNKKYLFAIKFACWFLFYGFFTLQCVNAQISIAVGDTLKENFDGIGTSATATLPTGWLIRRIGQNVDFGSWPNITTNYVNTEFSAGNGMISSPTAGLYNFGAGNAATDRAIGGLSGFGSLPPNYAYNSVNIYIKIKNVGSNTIEKFKITYKVEKYRRGTNSNGFRIQMGYSSGGLSFTSAGNNFKSRFPPDADNNGYLTAPGDSLIISNQYLAQSVAVNANYYFVWNYSVDGNNLSSMSNPQALGLDDVMIIPIAKPIVNTLSCSNSTSTTLTVNGEITSVNGDLATERGFIIYEADGTDKIIGGAGVTQYAENGLFNIGQFSHIFSNLCPNKTYSIRAYAINACGITYGTRQNCSTIPVSLNLSASSPICENDNFSINAISITGATYHWTNSSGIVQPSSTNILNLNLPAATYTFNCYYTLACGYTSPIVPISFTVNPKPLTSNIYHN